MRTAGRQLRVIVSVWLIGLSIACAADVVLLRDSMSHRLEYDQLRKVAELYGLNVRTVDSASAAPEDTAISYLGNPGTVALVTSYDALKQIDPKRMMKVLQRHDGTLIPVLVFAVTGDARSQQLGIWSRTAVQGCEPFVDAPRPTRVDANNVPDVNGVLAGLSLPAVTSPVCSLRFKASTEVEPVLTAKGNLGEIAMLLRCRRRDGEVFFAPELSISDASWAGDPLSTAKAFSSMAPFLIFLSYASGDYAWHLDGHYANLTIDDPWLTQPYGHLDYPALLAQMHRHNFHTTIGFVPWNYDRNESALVKLFASNSDRLSIAVHGNNHAHKEFGAYREHSLREQIIAIQQAVARMERFRSLTGITYDRFMIFPHGVAPEATLAELKRYDFSGTANSLNVPLGSPFPTDPLFVLRPYTRDYANFLSLFRYSADNAISPAVIAVQSFLGNPILFYGHQDLFQKSIEAFNGLAEAVNQVQPETRWTSLGEIARRLHMSRKRADGTFDLKMFSDDADIENVTDANITYHVQCAERDLTTLKSFTIDGQVYSRELCRDGADLTIAVPAHTTRRIRTSHWNSLSADVDVRKTNLYVRAIRLISDFRDLYLSRSTVGAAISRAYYRFQVDSIELYLEKHWWIGVGICVAFAGFCRWRLSMRLGKQKRPDKANSAYSTPDPKLSVL